MLIELKNIQKTYSTKAGVTFRALSNVSTSFDNTGLVFLVGQSGSGKSTLLNVIGGLDSFDSGEITVAGRHMRQLSQREVDSFRNTLIGFVFQEFNLIDTLSVADNVRLALDMQDGKGNIEKVMAALEQVGIADKAKGKTKNLSGGQRQRIAIARALVKDPRIVLADEPTGALDTAMGDEIFGIFKKMSADRLVIIVTHDLEKAAQYGDRIIEMKDGRIYRDVRRRAEGEAPEPEGVQILSDTLVRIDPGQNISDIDVERINNIISDSGRKTFLSFETDGRKVKAMFPNLREAVDVTVKANDDTVKNGADGEKKVTVEGGADTAKSAKKTTKAKSSKKVQDSAIATDVISSAQSGQDNSAGVDNVAAEVDGNVAQKSEENDSAQTVDIAATVKDRFVPYKSKNEPTPTFEYKKSKLPASKVLRLGANNLRHKKGRLVLTVIMSILAFALFGVAQSFTGYNAQNAIAKTISEEHYQTAAVINGEANATQMTRIRQSDIDLLTANNPKVKLYPQYNLEVRVKNTVNRTTAFSGVVEVDDVSEIGHSMYAGASSAPDFNSIIISQVVATSLVSESILKVDTVADAVGHTVNLSGRDYVIAGIIACDMNKYDSMSADKKSAVKTIDDSTGNKQLFVKPGFIENYVLTLPSSTAFNVALDIGMGDKNNSKSTPITLVAATDENMEKVRIDNAYGADGSMQIASQNDVFLAGDDAFLYDLRLVKHMTAGASHVYKSIDQLNDYSERRMTITYGVDSPVFASNEFHIAGLMFDSNGSGTDIAKNGIMVHKNVFAAIYRNIIYPSQLIAQLPDDENATRRFINSMYDIGLKVNSAYVTDYDTVLAFLSILRYVVLGLSIALSLLVVVLLYSFISASIRSTKKQIGILRALGAKQSDTFKIYAGEGFLVTIFALIVASVLLAVVAPLLNLVFSQMYGYYFSLISIEWWVYAVMAALTVVVTLLAVLLPLRKFSKITPISAISERD